MLQGETEGKIQGFATDIEGELIKEACTDIQRAMRPFWSLDDCMTQRENQEETKRMGFSDWAQHLSMSRVVQTGRTFYTGGWWVQKGQVCRPGGLTRRVAPGGAVLMTKSTHTNTGRRPKNKRRNKHRAALGDKYALAMDATLTARYLSSARNADYVFLRLFQINECIRTWEKTCALVWKVDQNMSFGTKTAFEWLKLCYFLDVITNAHTKYAKFKTLVSEDIMSGNKQLTRTFNSCGSFYVKNPFC